MPKYFCFQLLTYQMSFFSPCSHFIVCLFNIDMEGSLYFLQPWQVRRFLPLLKSSHLLGWCSPSSSSSVVVDRSVTTWLLSFWVHTNTSCCNYDNICSTLDLSETIDTLMSLSLRFFRSLCRNGDLDWQCTGPVLITGCVCMFCHWLHDAATLCLLFKGLEISSARCRSAWPALHPSLVVGCTHHHITLRGN